MSTKKEVPHSVLFYYMGKGAKIATINLKMGNYNSGKLKGAKLYTVN